MSWVKKGRIYVVDGLQTWNRSHASVPTVFPVNANVLRVYYSTRDEKNRCHISYIELSAADPTEILYIHEEPILMPGTPGTFDDCGVMPSHVIQVGTEVWMYYIGWNVRNTIAYHNSIGLAISKDEGRNFRKFSLGPLFDRDYIEPFYSAMPYVLRDEGIWKMWYLSNTKWVQFKGKSEPYYHIKYAESDNGIDWKREGKVAIDFKNDSECGIVRAIVIKDPGVYRMWYSYRNLNGYRDNRNSSYRIGYAQSSDGIDWNRMDEDVGIDVSENGWDSDMIEYPFVFDVRGSRHMLYNGNTFGKSGFGYAVLEEK